MNRPIKFRGRNIDTGEVVFGDLRIIGIRPHIFKEAQCYYDEELIEVDEDSVAQLVGYDRDGREVYEGDELADNYEGADYEYVARTTVFAYSKPAGVIRHLHNVRLKEAVK